MPVVCFIRHFTRLKNLLTIGARTKLKLNTKTVSVTFTVFSPKNTKYNWHQAYKCLQWCPNWNHLKSPALLTQKVKVKWSKRKVLLILNNTKIILRKSNICTYTYSSTGVQICMYVCLRVFLTPHRKLVKLCVCTLLQLTIAITIS